MDKTAGEKDKLPSLQRAALGNSAYLGDLYDARRDDFCGISIFKKPIPEGATTVVDNQSTDFQFVYTEDFSNKTSKLDVSAELQISVLAGLVSLEGSGRYLEDHKASARSVRNSIVYNIKTKKESLNIYHEDLKQAFSLNAIKNRMATHVVVQVEWGANSILTCEYRNTENRFVKEIEGKLHAKVDAIVASVEGGGAVDIDEEDLSSGEKLEITMTGDVVPKDGQLPTTIKEAVELMTKLPDLVKDSNAGKGKPINFRLIPIATLQKYLELDMKVDSLIKSLDAASLVRVVKLSDEMNEAQQKLNDFYQDAFNFRGCVPADDLKSVAQLMDKTKVQEAAFRSELSTALIQIRSGKKEGIILEQLIRKIISSEESPDKITERLAKWSDIIERIDFARLVIRNGAKYIGVGTSLDEEMVTNFKATFYILFISKEGKEDLPVWGENRKIFFDEMKKYQDEKEQEKEKEKDKNEKKDQVPDRAFLVVDCDIHPQYQVKAASSVIKVMKGTKILIADLREERERIRRISFVKFVEGTTKRTWDGAPTKRAPLTLNCPSKNCTASLIHDWHCTICMRIVDYGFDQYFYCPCGKSPAPVALFKCSEKTHGEVFVPHKEDYILRALSTAPPFGELNILVVGESAEKKFAWMNEFAAFLRGEPTEHLASNGTSNGSTEHSLEPDRTIYLFEVGSTNIRFISGPELNEKPDDGELKQLLGNMPYLEKISAICLLFNVDNDIMDDAFGNLFQKFTDCFGKEASKNVLLSFGSTEKHTGGIRSNVQLKLEQLGSANKDKQFDRSNDAVYIFESQEDNIVEANRMAKHMRQLKPLVNADKTESEYSTSMKLDGDVDVAFSLLKSGLRPGDAVIIKGFFMPNWEKFELLLSENIDKKSVPLSINMVKDGDATAIKFGKSESTVSGPQIKEGQLFDLKIICEKECFRVDIFGKKVFSQKPLVPADKISFVLLSAKKFTVTTITVTRV